MSDIKTLREAAETLTSRCIIATTGRTGDDHRRMVQIEDALAILCRREIGRMEGELGNSDRWTKAQIDERDKVIADNAWNAALQAGIDYIKEIVGDVATEKLNAFEVYAALNSLRKGPPND